MAQPLTVIGHPFLTTSPLDLIITTKDDASHFVVTDVKGNRVFKLKRPTFGNLLLRDAAGNPLVTLRQKTLTAHNRWNVYRGDSKSNGDLLFSVKESKKKKLDVFLAANTKEDVCDFHVQGSRPSGSSCDIYLGDSPDIVAQIHREKGVPSRLTVYPNIDSAFMVALSVIIHQNEPKVAKAMMDGVSDGVGESLVAALFSF